MDFFRSLAGQVTLELTSADIPGTLHRINCMGIAVYEIDYMGPMTVRLTVDRGNYGPIQKLVNARSEMLTIVKRRGLYWNLKNLLHRPVLVFGCFILLVFTLYLPTRVLFIRVEGNERISTNYIIETAERCGIGFGANRREVRSEQIKNRLLDVLPQLQWVGVNTRGCVAIISVRERSEPPEAEEKHQVGSIVALRDGVVKSCTVTRGSAKCAVGQAVIRGQVLISGFTDCGLCIQADRAEGEVMALTNRELSVVTPEKCAVREQNKPITKKFSIVIGKIRINFYKDSGILDTTCVKMYSENYMTLPGGFRLPMALGVEEWIPFEITQDTSLDCENILKDFAQRYLQSQMTAGQILHQQERIFGGTLEGEYACLEMIGQVRYEESITENEDH